jgi:hypothetical protein
MSTAESEPANLWWISWEQPGDDYRPLTWPPPRHILAYWCSGEGDDYFTVVAIVRALTPEAARAEVANASAWPDAGAERFCQPIAAPPGDRFPRPMYPEMVDRWPW